MLAASIMAMNCGTSFSIHEPSGLSHRPRWVWKLTAGTEARSTVVTGSCNVERGSQSARRGPLPFQRRKARPAAAAHLGSPGRANCLGGSLSRADKLAADEGSVVRKAGLAAEGARWRSTTASMSAPNVPQDVENYA